MKQRIITGLIFTLVVAGIILPGQKYPYLPMLFFALVAFIVTHEFRIAFKVRGFRMPLKLPVIIALLTLSPLILILTGLHPGTSRPGSVAAISYFLIFTAMSFTMVALMIRRGPTALPEAAMFALTIAYVAFPLSSPAIILSSIPDGFNWMLIGLISPWISDVFAYFIGSLFGRNKIVPRLSPKKTVEGCIGGIVGTMLIMMLYFWLFMQGKKTVSNSLAENMVLAATAGLLLSIASQMGDWLASAIKRWCGVKDFGTILPGHGGILDRFDSALFTLPMTLAISILAVTLS
jgi:phosphatidate cytidylyltransferase